MKPLTIYCLLFAFALGVCSNIPIAANTNQITQGIGEPNPIPPHSLPPSETANDVRQISAGNYFTCGIVSGGKTHCWGWNSFGRLGNNSNINGSNIPVSVSMPDGVSVTKISVGYRSACALDSNGKAYCWGSNWHGELGNGISGKGIHSTTPVAIVMPAEVSFTELSVGSYHTCALDSNNKAYCWGSGASGQLGNGISGRDTVSNTPIDVLMPTGVSFTQVSAGGDHTCALGSNSQAYCWGSNYFGQLGNGISGPDIKSNTPVAVAMPTGVSFTQISAGFYHTCALDPNGKAYCWGENGSGRLGNGNNFSSNNPQAVVMPAGVSFTQVSAGDDHTCALGSNSKAYCWGMNWYGQLGNGIGGDSITNTTPQAVKMPAGVSFVHISGGDVHTCALGSNSKAYCWGDNGVGQLGNGTNDASNIPVLTSPTDPHS